MAYVLDQYDPAIIKYVSDPFTGLPGSLRFPLEIADVRRACDAEKLRALALTWRCHDGTRSPAEKEAEAAETRLAEARQRYAEQARAEPVWPPIAAKLREKLRAATFRSAFASAKLGTFSDGNLQIVVPIGTLKDASGQRANITHWVRQMFPSVAAVHFVEDLREAGEVEALAKAMTEDIARSHGWTPCDGAHAARATADQARRKSRVDPPMGG